MPRFWNVTQEWSWRIQAAFQIVVIMGTVVAAYIAWGQLAQLHKNRDQDNYIAILSRLTEHNWHIAEDAHRKYAVDIFLQLRPDPPPAISDRDLYWATRMVHLSHLNLLEQIWILSGKQQQLSGDYTNWQRFALLLASHLSGKADAPQPEPYIKASSDLWDGLKKYDRMSPEFIRWFIGLDTRQISPTTARP